MGPFEFIQYEEPEEAVGVLTFNRPERLNALTWDMVDEIHACLSELERRHSTRVLILTGSGKGFCSGIDLKSEDLDHPPTMVQSVRNQRNLADLVLHLRKIPQPVIGAINGVAAGGGFSLALACDLRVAAESARFICAYINIGLGGGEMGSSYFLPRMIGAAKAAELIYTGRAVGSEEAERLGLVSRVAPAGKTLEAANELAQTLLGKSPFGLAMTKEVLNQSIDGQSLESVLYLENRTQMLTVRTDDFTEAIRAFSEKRPPNFSKS